MQQSLDASMVKSEKARASLATAETARNANDLKGAFEGLALAFDHLVNDYDATAWVGLGDDAPAGSPFVVGREQLRHANLSLRAQRDLGDVADVVAKLLAAAKETQEAVRILGMGLDYRRYLLFKRLTPDVEYDVGGGVHFAPPLQVPTMEHYPFCRNFVIESAQRLQEFEFTV
jgi:hypothetical protein